MGKRVAIVQSNYIPWKGYFDLINLVDEFILFDDVQYTRRDWRNRNRIKTPAGPAWLTIPVRAKGRFDRPIREIEIDDLDWGASHWRAIAHNYARAPYFRAYRDRLEPLWTEAREPLLSQVNERFLSALCGLLGIRTRLTRSMDYHVVAGKTERLVELCRQAGAAVYLSGPAARSYLDEEPFRQAGIVVEWMDYAGYPEYRQLFPPFDHYLSVVDLILNEGPAASRFLKSFGAGAASAGQPAGSARA